MNSQPESRMELSWGPVMDHVRHWPAGCGTRPAKGGRSLENAKADLDSFGWES
jgi:hypothetical protein